MSKQKRNELYNQFIQNLEKLAGEAGNTGDRAALKRAVGNTLAESRTALSVFYKYLPPPLFGNRYEEIFFLVATIRFHNRHAFTGNFGASMRVLKNQFDSESLDNRFRTLLDSVYTYHFGILPGELGYRLRQCVKLAESKLVGIDWLQLLKDLLYWDHERKFIQKRWAQSYYASKQENSEDKENVN